MNRRIILAHPFGNANVRQALAALHDAGMLERFITTISADHVGIRKILPASVQTEIERRRFPSIPKSTIETHPHLESLRLIGARAARAFPGLANSFPTVDDVWESTDWYLRRSLRGRDSEDLSVYAYEDGAYNTFSSLKEARKVYELPIGYWRSMHSLLKEERERKPEWAATLSGLKDPQAKLDRKDRELELADQIIVPSDFVESTLPLVHQGRTAVVPYGCPVPVSENQVYHSPKGALKVFFCGSLGQRKGISYLFDAVARMAPYVEVTVVGTQVAPCAALTNALRQTKWYPSLPNQAVLELMRQSDVLVFPTLFEGRALVVLEALSQGIPVITTINSGTADVIVNGESGFLVPARSTEEIYQALESLYLDRELLSHMKEGALRIAGRSGWAQYRQRLVEAIRADCQ
jgi:alpha-maltose-1-phosphate synthase